MGPKQVPPCWVSVELGLMATKEWFHIPQYPRIGASPLDTVFEVRKSFPSAGNVVSIFLIPLTEIPYFVSKSTYRYYNLLVYFKNTFIIFIYLKIKTKLDSSTYLYGRKKVKKKFLHNFQLSEKSNSTFAYFLLWVILNTNKFVQVEEDKRKRWAGNGIWNIQRSR